LQEVSTAAHKLAVSVVEKCVDKLEPYVQRFLTSVMLEGKSLKSGLHCDCHEIIYEIYCCAPQMLLAVIPNLTQELLTDQVDVRLKAVQLLGRLFALPGRHVAQEYRLLFSEFLKRFGDKAVEVRIAVVRCAKVCLEANPSGLEASEILASLEDRLLDFDDKVRMTVVKAVCDLVKVNLKWVPTHILRKVADRLRDKKVFVRKDTLQKLTEVYKIYCTKCIDGSVTLDKQFEWIPSKIVRCCYDKDCKDFKPQGMEIVFTEELFEADLSVEERAKHWIALFSNFDENDRKALQYILLQKQR
jgi:sister-chromatid-cohesion protein PDS5